MLFELGVVLFLLLFGGFMFICFVFVELSYFGNVGVVVCVLKMMGFLCFVLVVLCVLYV